MKTTDIHQEWGTELHVTPRDFFDQPYNYWRDLLYERKLLVFKKMKFSIEEYVTWSLRFGIPWDKQDYKYTTEVTQDVYITTLDGVRKTIPVSPFSNKYSPRLGMSAMDWHADIPNKLNKPFPIRSLWMQQNPNNKSGITSFLNIEDGLDLLSPHLSHMLPDVEVTQQSWYSAGSELHNYDAIKQHPITGRRSLRVNYFNIASKGRHDAWIKSTKIHGVVDGDCGFIEEVIDDLLQHKELLYKHIWDDDDLIVFDNWSFVHNRSALVFGEDKERLLIRITIDHLDSDEWIKHKQEFFNEH